MATKSKEIAGLKQVFILLEKQKDNLLDLSRKVNDHSDQIHDLRYPPDRATPALQPENERVVSNLILTTATQEPLSMANVERQVCRSAGHRISVLERQIPNTELPDPSKAFHHTTKLKQEILCLACGMTLDEIRGAK